MAPRSNGVMTRTATSSRAVVLLTALLASCGGGGAQPTTPVETTPPATADTTTTLAAVTTTTETATTAAVTTTAPAVANDCPPPATPASGWRFLQTPSWKIYHPADWDDVSGEGPQATAGIHFDETTIAESGVDGSEPLIEFALVAPGGAAVLVLTHLEGPTSSLEEIYQRAEDRYSQSADFEEMIEEDVAECLGGEPAMRVDFMTGGFFQQSWFSLHHGSLFHADFLAPSPDAADLAADIFATWEWITPFELTPIGDAFVAAEMAADIDTSASEPDPSWFTNQFTTQTSTIYAVFQLTEGISGQVEAFWTLDGEELLTYEFFYEPTDNWGYVGMTDGGGDFDPGDYQLVITLDDNVARVVLDFSVVEA